MKSGEISLLGVLWDKEKDIIKVNFPDSLKEITKRSVLGDIAKIYDPLGNVTPSALQGKFFFRDICDARLPRDKEVTLEFLAKWVSSERVLPKEVETARSLVGYQEDIKAIDLHAFGDAICHVCYLLYMQ